MPLAPVARDKGRLQWWAELVVCTHSDVGTTAWAYVMARDGCRNTLRQPGQTSRARANYRFTGSCRGSGY